MVHVLNLRLCQGRYPKWVRRYADMATMVKRTPGSVFAAAFEEMK